MLGRVDSLVLAKYIAVSYEVSPLKLQKLLYYVQAWHLAITGEPVMNDKFQAWIHSPVIPKIYKYFKKHYGMYDTICFKFRRVDKIIDDYEDAELTEDQYELINDILEEYGDITAYKLELLTHQEDPWREARRGLDTVKNGRNVISEKTMRRYYARRYRDEL